MEDYICFDIVNSAPLSECEDSDEIIVLSKAPDSVENLDFTPEEAFFSPAGISALSSPKFVEMILASQNTPTPSKEKSKQRESLKKSKNKENKHQKCKDCNNFSESGTVLACGCYCKFYLDCEDCSKEFSNSHRTCGCGNKFDIQSNNSSSLLLENANISKKYSEAMWMLSIIDMLTDKEIYEQQKLLINSQSTVVVKVQSKAGDFAWEVPCEFTVNDLVDLVSLVTNQSGILQCDDRVIDSRLMLGFVRLYVWRKIDLLTFQLL